MFSVNFHIMRTCNMDCTYCFHSNAILAPMMPIGTTLTVEEMCRGVELLAENGCTKLNVAGGEPFFCRDETIAVTSHAHALGLFTSVITNGLLAEPHHSIDMLGVSIDSFNRNTNALIGRKTVSMERLHKLRDGSSSFKINTVVSKLNHMEDMNRYIEELNPDRWKLFQVLSVDGENDGHGTEITSFEFDDFARLHPRGIPENNDVMANSYLILDENMRFLDGVTKKPFTDSILVDESAIKSALGKLDMASFLKRQGGFYL